MTEMHTVGYASGAEDAALYVLSPRPKKGEVVEHAGKRFFLKSDGTIGKELKNHTFYTPAAAEYDSGDIRSLARALSAVVDGAFGPAFLVRGCPMNPRSTTRRKPGRPGKDGKILPGVRDEPSRHVLLDLDKLPNPEGHDPRVDWLEGAAMWALSLMPDALRRAGWVVVASSSCCLRDGEDRPLPPGVPPPTLNFHLHGILSEEMDEKPLRAALRAVDGHMRSELMKRYGISADRVLDPSTATSNQAVFVAPSFAHGVDDPFAGMPRMWVRKGELVDIDAALSECLPGPAEEAVEKPARTRRRREPAAPLTAEQRLAMAMRGAERAERALRIARAEQRVEPEPGAKERGRRASYFEWAYLARLDLCRLADARRESGVWPHGMPEGSGRNMLLLKLAALARASGMATPLARDFVLDFAREYMQGGEELAAAWPAKYPTAFTGWTKPGKAGLIEDLGISEADVDALGLEAFRTKADRIAAKRGALVDKGLTTRGKVRQRSADGDQAEQEAKALGISRATLMRRRAAERAAAKAAAPAPIQPTPPPFQRWSPADQRLIELTALHARGIFTIPERMPRFSDDEMAAAEARAVAEGWVRESVPA